jgi:hypothetical protein
MQFLHKDPYTFHKKITFTRFFKLFLQIFQFQTIKSIFMYSIQLRWYYIFSFSSAKIALNTIESQKINMSSILINVSKSMNQKPLTVISFFLGNILGFSTIWAITPFYFYFLKSFLFDGFHTINTCFLGFFFGSILSSFSFLLSFCFHKPSGYIFLNVWMEPLSYFILIYFYCKVVFDFFEKRDGLTISLSWNYIQEIDMIEPEQSFLDYIKPLKDCFFQKKTYGSFPFYIGIGFAIFEQPRIYSLCNSIVPSLAPTFLEFFVENTILTFLGFFVIRLISFPLFLIFMHKFKSFIWYWFKDLKDRENIEKAQFITLENRKEKEKNMKKISRKVSNFKLGLGFLRESVGYCLVAFIAALMYFFNIDYLFFGSLGFIPKDYLFYNTAFDPYFLSDELFEALTSHINEQERQNYSQMAFYKNNSFGKSRYFFSPLLLDNRLGMLSAESFKFSAERLYFIKSIPFKFLGFYNLTVVEQKDQLRNSNAIKLKKEKEQSKKIQQKEQQKQNNQVKKKKNLNDLVNEINSLTFEYIHKKDRKARKDFRKSLSDQFKKTYRLRKKDIVYKVPQNLRKRRFWNLQRNSLIHKPSEKLSDNRLKREDPKTKDLRVKIKTVDARFGMIPDYLSVGLQTLVANKARLRTRFYNWHIYSFYTNTTNPYNAFKKESEVMAHLKRESLIDRQYETLPIRHKFIREGEFSRMPTLPLSFYHIAKNDKKLNSYSIKPLTEEEEKEEKELNKTKEGKILFIVSDMKESQETKAKEKDTYRIEKDEGDEEDKAKEELKNLQSTVLIQKDQKKVNTGKIGDEKNKEKKFYNVEAFPMKNQEKQRKKEDQNFLSAFNKQVRLYIKDQDVHPIKEEIHNVAFQNEVDDYIEDVGQYPNRSFLFGHLRRKIATMIPDTLASLFEENVLQKLLYEYKELTYSFFVDRYFNFIKYTKYSRYLLFNLLQLKKHTLPIYSPNQELDLSYKKLYYLQYLNSLRNYSKIFEKLYNQKINKKNTPEYLLDYVFFSSLCKSFSNKFYNHQFKGSLGRTSPFYSITQNKLYRYPFSYSKVLKGLSFFTLKYNRIYYNDDYEIQYHPELNLDFKRQNNRNKYTLGFNIYTILKNPMSLINFFNENEELKNTEAKEKFFSFLSRFLKTIKIISINLNIFFVFFEKYFNVFKYFKYSPKLFIRTIHIIMNGIDGIINIGLKVLKIFVKFTRSFILKVHKTVVLWYILDKISRYFIIDDIVKRLESYVLETPADKKARIRRKRRRRKRRKYIRVVFNMILKRPILNEVKKPRIAIKRFLGYCNEINILYDRIDVDEIGTIPRTHIITALLRNNDYLNYINRVAKVLWFMSNPFHEPTAADITALKKKLGQPKTDIIFTALDWYQILNAINLPLYVLEAMIYGIMKFSFPKTGRFIGGWKDGWKDRYRVEELLNVLANPIRSSLMCPRLIKTQMKKIKKGFYLLSSYVEKENEKIKEKNKKDFSLSNIWINWRNPKTQKMEISPFLERLNTHPLSLRKNERGIFLTQKDKTNKNKKIEKTYTHWPMTSGKIDKFYECFRGESQKYAFIKFVDRFRRIFLWEPAVLQLKAYSMPNELYQFFQLPSSSLKLKDKEKISALNKKKGNKKKNKVYENKKYKKNIDLTLVENREKAEEEKLHLLNMFSSYYQAHKKYFSISDQHIKDSYENDNFSMREERNIRYAITKVMTRRFLPSFYKEMPINYTKYTLEHGDLYNSDKKSISELVLSTFTGSINKPTLGGLFWKGGDLRFVYNMKVHNLLLHLTRKFAEFAVIVAEILHLELVHSKLGSQKLNSYEQFLKDTNYYRLLGLYYPIPLISIEEEKAIEEAKKKTKAKEEDKEKIQKIKKQNRPTKKV